MTTLHLSELEVSTEQVARIPWIVDVDAHIIEPPEVWSSRLPSKYKQIGPHIEYHPIQVVDGPGYVEVPGTDGPDVPWWVYEDYCVPIMSEVAAAGRPPEEVTLSGIAFEDIRPGCWQLPERLADMDLCHVEAQMCFPNFPRFAGQVFIAGKDAELARLCVCAYNDWMVEEWSGESGGRQIPLCLVPLWDVQLAAAEVRRNAARGVRAVAFAEVPAYLDLPSIHSGYWNPFFEACDETSTVVCMHIGSGSKIPTTSADAPLAITATIISGATEASLTDYLFSGVLDRYPGLRLMYAEAQIGWIPYILGRADDVWATHPCFQGQRSCPEPPSTYYYRQVTNAFFRDPIGIEMLNHVGVDNVAFETDYPHQDTTWPHCREAAAKQFGFLPQPDIDKIARNNAIELFGLSLARSSAVHQGQEAR